MAWNQSHSNSLVCLYTYLKALVLQMLFEHTLNTKQNFEAVYMVMLVSLKDSNKLPFNERGNKSDLDFTFLFFFSSLEKPKLKL